jgi:hypothetical protein
MSLKIPDISELTLLGYIRSQIVSGCLLHLYTNDKVPADGDTLASYTEASFGGYAPAPVSGWTQPAQQAGAARMQASPVTFTVAGPPGALIYGYFVTDPGGNLLWAERDPQAPVNMQTVGNSYTITPVFTMHSEF